MLCIAGKNNIAVNALKFLIEDLKIDKNQICVIPNNNDTGVDSWQKSFKRYALENNISLIKLEDSYNCDIFISLEFDKIIKPSLFQSTRLYNMHFSALPAYRGMYTSCLPLLHGMKQTGVTLHYIDEGIDTGDIIAQDLFLIDINDNARSLYDKYLYHGLMLFKKTFLYLFSLKKILAKKQRCLGASYFNKKSIDYRNITIDIKKSSYEIYNQLRAYIFPEYQLPTINNKQIISVTLLDEVVKPFHLEEQHDYIYLSGMDGYLIKAKIV